MNAIREYHTATLLTSGKVLVAGGFDGGLTPSVEVYDPAANTWTTVAPLNSRRHSHTATLLPNGRVFVLAGINDTGFLASAEIYDPALNTWTKTPRLSTARYVHTATLLLDGRLLAVGGYNGSQYLTSAEIYDVGLGFQEAWRPTISSMPASLLSGTALSFTGTGLRGYQFADGSGGGTYGSPSNVPLVQLRSLDNEQVRWLTPASFTGTSYTSLPITGFPKGPAMVTVFVNGIPSQSKLLMLRDYFYVYLPLVRK